MIRQIVLEISSLNSTLREFSSVEGQDFLALEVVCEIMRQ